MRAVAFRKRLKIKREERKQYEKETFSQHDAGRSHDSRVAGRLWVRR